MRFTFSVFYSWCQSFFYIHASKGPSIKDVRRDGEGVWSNADTCEQGEGGKGPCGRPQDGTLIKLFQHALQTLPMDDGY